MISRHPRVWLYALAAFMVAGACGPDGCVKPVEQCPPGVKCITYDQYCDQSNGSLWEMGQVCGVIAKDVPYPGFPARDYRCSGELAQLIDAGAVTFNPVAAQLCIESRKTTCDPACRWELVNDFGVQPFARTVRCSPPCDRIFSGIKETGEACSLSDECLEGLWCDTRNSCPGRCARQSSNGQLTPGLEACRSPFTVQLFDGGVVCDDLRDAGALCGKSGGELAFHHCQPGYACQPKPPDVADGGDGGLDGGDDAGIGDGGASDAGEQPLVCVPWPDAGAVPTLGCSASGCPYGQICTGMFGFAETCVPIAKAGEACSTGFNPRPCQGGLQCIPDGGTGDGVCGKAVAGTPCNLLTCSDGTYCAADGGCANRAALGAACANTNECTLGLLCITSNDAGTCFTPSLGGGACGDPAGHQCAYGFDCHDGGCLAKACLASP